MKNQKNPINNMAMASMIVSINSLFMLISPPIQFVLGVIGILLAIFSKKEKPFSGFAIAGLVISVVSLFLSLLIVWFSYQLLQNPDFAPLLDLMSQVYKEMYGSAPVK